MNKKIFLILILFVCVSYAYSAWGNPDLTNWEYSAITKNLTLTFNETMNASTIDLTKINITYADGTPYYGTGPEGQRHLSLGNGSVTDSDANSIVITLNSSHDHAIRTIEASAAAQMDMGVGAIKNTVGIDAIAEYDLPRTTYTDWRIRRVLNSGWGVFSLTTFALKNATAAGILANTNITNVLESIDGNYQIIYAYNSTSGGWLVYSPTLAANSFLNFSSETDTTAYQIYMTAPDVIEIP